jgi:peptidoglycan/xylan/chitin deacetylase (PgdA/CDA1 family)
MKIGSILYRGAIFQFKDTEEKKMYLTFDDGPTEDLTSWILNLLKTYQAKATFFCLGKNAERFPGHLQQILDEGHVIGNHTFHHLKGWCTKNKDYYRDIELAQTFLNSSYFRPPHGRMKLSQYKHLKQSYSIVLWDVLAKDYRENYSPARILQRIIRKAGPGSILVFHDSQKAEANLKQVLPEVLNYYYKQGYTFHSVPPK